MSGLKKKGPSRRSPKRERRLSITDTTGAQSTARRPFKRDQFKRIFEDEYEGY